MICMTSVAIIQPAMNRTSTIAVTCKIAGVDEGVREVTVPGGKDWDAATWGRNEPTLRN